MCVDRFYVHSDIHFGIAPINSISEILKQEKSEQNPNKLTMSCCKHLQPDRTRAQMSRIHQVEATGQKQTGHTAKTNAAHGQHPNVVLLPETVLEYVPNHSNCTCVEGANQSISPSTESEKVTNRQVATSDNFAESR